MNILWKIIRTDRLNYPTPRKQGYKNWLFFGRAEIAIFLKLNSYYRIEASFAQMMWISYEVLFQTSSGFTLIKPDIMKTIAKAVQHLTGSVWLHIMMFVKQRKLDMLMLQDLCFI